MAKIPTCSFEGGARGAGLRFIIGIVMKTSIISWRITIFLASGGEVIFLVSDHSLNTYVDNLGYGRGMCRFVAKGRMK